METQNTLLNQYMATRRQTMRLAEGLSAEDLTAQSMPDASPGKWHLAHTTWFFETFILQKFSPNFEWFNPHFCHLFNSYYESVGSRHARPQRGLLTRPALDQVIEYRQHVDTLMHRAMECEPEVLAPLVTIGLHHEMQHQELFLTDILHLLWHSPMFPSVINVAASTSTSGAKQQGSPEYETKNRSSNPSPVSMQAFEGGLIEVGVTDELNKGEQTSANDCWTNFSFDCERPRHTTFVHPFRLASRLVNNGEWLEFMRDGGYQNALLWLSDGWSRCQMEGWDTPLYWLQRDGGWLQFGLDGLREIDLLAPVCHVSYYEADAFARWRQKRLPREHEWELAAAEKPIRGNFLESCVWRPLTDNSPTVSAALAGSRVDDLYGDVWEWTQSAYAPYPGFQAGQGALGEYNGKFMANQCVLRGGSCVTPLQQMRTSYRNFFYPHQRWQFSGLRLAEDL
ncbi:MAG: ergothioneine biosynthesis protein EgtB [Lentisphaeria bacterium]